MHFTHCTRRDVAGWYININMPFICIYIGIYETFIYIIHFANMYAVLFQFFTSVLFLYGVEIEI